jgi:hypothetical protein
MKKSKIIMIADSHCKQSLSIPDESQVVFLKGDSVDKSNSLTPEILNQIPVIKVNIFDVISGNGIFKQNHDWSKYELKTNLN